MNPSARLRRFSAPPGRKLPSITRFASSIVLVLLSVSICRAGEPDIPPREEKPVRIPAVPLSPAEEAHREALTRFGLGFFRTRDDRLADAVKQYRAALQNDPQALEPKRELVKVYAELGRDAAAIRTAREVLARDPDDFETAQRLGRLLMGGKKYPEAAKALLQAVNSPHGKDDFGARLVLLRELGNAAERAGDHPAREKAAREQLTLFQASKAALVKIGAFAPEEVERQRARCYEELGHALVGLRKFDSASAAFEAARDLYADPKGANDRSGLAKLHWNLSGSHAAQGEPEKALKELDLYLEQRPAGFAPYERWVKLMTESQRGTEISGTLTRLARLNPSNPAPAWLAASAKLQTDSRAGDTAFRELLKSADKPEYFRVLVKAYATAGLAKEFLDLADGLFIASRPKRFYEWKKGDPPLDLSNAAEVERARFLNEATKTAGGFTAALLQQLEANLKAGAAINSDTVELLMALASRDRMLPEFAAALQQATAQRGGNFRISWLLIKCLHSLRRWEELVRTADRLKELDGNRISLGIAVQVAVAYAELGQEAKAMASIGQIDGRVFVRIEKAKLYNILDKHREALKELEEILKLDKPKGDELHGVRVTMIQTLQHLKEEARAEAIMREMLDNDPDDVLILNNFGYHLADQGRNLDEAETMIRRAIELDRDAKLKVGDPDAESGNYLDSLGWVLFKKGEFAEARKALEGATKFVEVSENGVVWDHLGDTYLRLELKKDAATAYGKAIELFTGTHEGRQLGRLAEVKRKLKSVE